MLASQTPTLKIIPTGRDGGFHASNWKSEDGRVEIHLDPTFETECDNPHPVRVRLDKYRDLYGDRAADSLKNRLGAKVTLKRLKDGTIAEYVSYLCDGGEVHYYSQWTVSIDDDWTDNVYDTFEQARGVVEQRLGVTTVVARARTS